MPSLYIKAKIYYIKFYINEIFKIEANTIKDIHEILYLFNLTLIFCIFLHILLLHLATQILRRDLWRGRDTTFHTLALSVLIPGLIRLNVLLSSPFKRKHINRRMIKI